MTNEDLDFVQNKIGYKFSNSNLLKQAFVKKDFYKENVHFLNSEVLEFYGDRILSFLISRQFYDRYSNINETNQFCSQKTEGQLSDEFIITTKNETLAFCMEKFDFTKFLCSEKKSKTKKNKDEGDLFEAILGAVAADCDWNIDILTDVVQNMLLPKEDFVSTKTFIDLLQELCDEKGFSIIEYVITKNTSNKNCNVQVDVGEKILSFSAKGKTDKLAKLAAAQKAFTHINLIVLGNMIDTNLVDAVSQLSLLHQKKKICAPEYYFEFFSSTKKDYRQYWKCDCKISDINQIFSAESNDSKSAKQAAAKLLLQTIMKKNDENKKPCIIRSGKGLLHLILSMQKKVC